VLLSFLKDGPQVVIETVHPLFVPLAVVDQISSAIIGFLRLDSCNRGRKVSPLVPMKGGG
jgi:hypothetical protein